jgi:aldehyde dehydrogenase (NAD+)
MFIPVDRQDEVKAIPKAAAKRVFMGNVDDSGTTIGLVVSEVQFNKIQRLIQVGIDEGVELMTGESSGDKKFMRLSRTIPQAAK